MEPAGLDGLLQRARRHDPEALHALFDLYHRRVFGLLYRLTGSRDSAEDLLQETFLRLVRHIGSYDHAGRFEAWLFRIAANLARDHARKHRRRGPTASLDGDADGTGLLDRLAAEPDDPASGLLAEEQRRRLAELLERLSPQDREILMLRHYGELSFQEIAELLGIPLGTALARAHRALKRLRASFEQSEAAERRTP